MLLFLLVFHNQHLHPKRNKMGSNDEKIIILVKCLIAIEDEYIYIYIYSNFIVKLIEILEG